MSDSKAEVRAAMEVQEFVGQAHIAEFFARIESDMVENMLKLSPNSKHDETRYRYKVAIEVGRNVRRMFEQVIRDGKVAEHRLELDKAKGRNALW